MVKGVLFKASRYIEELYKYAPKVLESCRESLAKATTDLKFIPINQEQFESCPDISVDYAIMEKTDSCVVVPMNAA